MVESHLLRTCPRDRRTAVGSASMNRAPHAVSPSRAAGRVPIPRCCIAHSAPCLGCSVAYYIACYNAI